MEVFPAINKLKTLTLSPMFKTQIIGYGNGVEQRLALNSLPLTKFTLNFVQALSLTDIYTILDFFVDRQGSFDPFLFPRISPSSYGFFVYEGDSAWSDSNLANDPYKVRFNADLINADFFQYNLGTFQTVEMIEVRD